MDYITLTKEDPEFESYLLGTFSETERALPVETYNPDTSRERVTFKVVSVEKLNLPPWWKVYFWSCRPELLALTLGPAVAAGLNHRFSAVHALAALSFIGVFFLHTAMFLFNDVRDHLRGADRTNRRRGSRVIQNGWVPAHRLRTWAWVNFGLAAALGLPAFFYAPWSLPLVCVGAAALLLLLQKKWGARYGLCDLAIVLLFGPLMTVGTAEAGFGHANATDLALGAAFGLTTLWVFQIRQFEELFRSKPEDFQTFIAYLDFDRARKIAVIEGFLLLAIHPMAGLFLRVPLLALACLPLASWPLMSVLSRFQKTASPLSGEMVGLARGALRAHLALSAWWLVALGLTWL